MRLIRVGSHMIRLDSIDYIVDHSEAAERSASAGVPDANHEIALTLFLRGRETGIDMIGQMLRPSGTSSVGSA